ncbi:MAG: hypothetical protein ACI31W_03190 [Lactococcus sp.]
MIKNILKYKIVIISVLIAFAVGGTGGYFLGNYVSDKNQQEKMGQQMSFPGNNTGGNNSNMPGGAPNGNSNAYGPGAGNGSADANSGASSNESGSTSNNDSNSVNGI